MINNRVLQHPEPLGNDNIESTGSIDFQENSNISIIRKNGWKEARTKLEKKLFCICAFLMGLALGLLIALCVVASRNSPSEAARSRADNHRECQSLACQKAAEALSTSMDRSADPCEDFFQYACGGWIARNPIPDDQGRYSTFDILRDEVSEELTDILKSTPNASHTEAETKAFTFYQACIDEEAREAHGLDPLKDQLVKFGGWPMTDTEWKSTGYEWQKSVAKMVREVGYCPIISISVEADANQTSQNIIFLERGGFGLGRNQLVNLNSSTRNIEIVEAYKNFIIATAKLLYPNTSETNLEKDADDIIQFESSLAKMSKPPEETRDPRSWYNKVKLSDVQRITENIYFTWTDFLNDVLKGLPQVNNDTEVIISEMDYTKNTLKLIKDTDSRTVANYIGWSFLRKFGRHTTKAFRDNTFQLTKVERGIQKATKLERTCTDEVVKLLGYAVGRLYVDEYFSEESKKDAEELVEDIRLAYQLSLHNNQWMDENTKAKALDKLKSMINMMGYPSWIKDDDELNKKYEMVKDIKADEFFTSMLKVRKAAVGKILKKWNQPTNRTNEWVSQASVVNAFYNPSANSITFPAGILNLPFYKYGRSLALNLGGIGSIIGHEMSHGFDDQGSQFDEEGNIKNWWTKETKDEFNKKAQCFRDQYSSYLDHTTNMHLNGNNSVGENIADNGGLRNAYLAYKTQVLLEENNEIIETRLPGIDATPEQLFFIGFAAIWCGTERKESLELSIQYDSHSPFKYRVLVPLSNSAAFAEAFNCPVGSSMNPESKCTLW